MQKDFIKEFTSILYEAESPFKKIMNRGTDLKIKIKIPLNKYNLDVSLVDTSYIKDFYNYITNSLDNLKVTNTDFVKFNYKHNTPSPETINVEKFVQNLNVRLEYDNTYSIYPDPRNNNIERPIVVCNYNVSSDIITMCSQHCFEYPEIYPFALLHELAHWTGHSYRLNRISWPVPLRIEWLIREEFVANFVALHYCNKFNIDMKLPNEFTETLIKLNLENLLDPHESLQKAFEDSLQAIAYIDHKYAAVHDNEMKMWA